MFQKEQISTSSTHWNSSGLQVVSLKIWKNPGGGCYKTQIPRPQIRPPRLLNQNYLQIGQAEEAWEYRSPVSSPGDLNAGDGQATPAPTRGDPEQFR